MKVYESGRESSLLDDSQAGRKAIEHLPTFRSLVETNGISATVPRADTIDAAVAECYNYYRPEEEAKYGTLPIHFRLADPSELPS